MIERRLDKLYVCQKCKTAFLFKSDVEDHDRLWGHNEFTTVPLELSAQKFKHRK